jgi:hypothetical protein
MANKFTVSIKDITITMENQSSSIDETTSELVSRLVMQKDSLLIHNSEILSKINEFLTNKSEWDRPSIANLLSGLQISIEDALNNTTNLKDAELVNQLNNIKFKVSQFLAANEKSIGGTTEKFITELLELLKD